MLRRLLALLEEERAKNQRASVARRPDKTLYDVGFADGTEAGLVTAIGRVKELIEEERGLEDDNLD